MNYSMLRFCDQQLPPRPHIAILFAGKIGGFVVSTPLLRGLHQKYPGCTIDYFGGEQTRDLEESCPLIASRFSLHGDSTSMNEVTAYIQARTRDVGLYDLAINLDNSERNSVVTGMLNASYICGSCIDVRTNEPLPFLDNYVDALWLEHNWHSPNFFVKYSHLLTTSYIGEIFCRLAYIDTDFTHFTIPRMEVYGLRFDVLIGTSTTRAVKRWHTQGWKEVINWCNAYGFTVGLLGSSPEIERRQYTATNQEEELLGATALIDIRGQFTLPQVADLLAQARVCIAVDAGIMHLAVGVGTPTIAIFGNFTSSPALWAPRTANIHIVFSPEYCGLCEAHRFRNRSCLRLDHHHPCMNQVTSDDVLSHLVTVI